jgi:hypothetical protein
LPKTIALTPVLSRGDYLQVGLNVKTGHRPPLQRMDVIDLMPDTRFFRKSTSFGINRPNFPGIGPRWY